jgi:hypothetical protein
MSVHLHKASKIPSTATWTFSPFAAGSTDRSDDLTNITISSALIALSAVSFYDLPWGFISCAHFFNLSCFFSFQSFMQGPGALVAPRVFGSIMSAAVLDH